MAKPYSNLPGCSGHIHLSLNTKDGKNLFFDSDSPDKTSSLLKAFVAGVLKGLPSIMALLAPNINRFCIFISYKRLNINFWAPVNISMGFDDRCSALRIITPPVCSLKATRIEIRVPGADINAYLALSGIIACGYYGINNKLELPSPKEQQQQLPPTLTDAVFKMSEPNSIARQVLGNEFVEHYATTRSHEIREYNSTVTNWELERYMETC